MTIAKPQFQNIGTAAFFFAKNRGFWYGGSITRCHCEEAPHLAGRRSNPDDLPINSFMARDYYVYIMTNERNTVIYTGVTNNLERRIYQHKQKLVKGFTEQYNVSKLVYVEQFNDVNEVIKREKQIKGGSRKKKEDLVNSFNPEWKDLTGF